jgi:hypothetical protein
VCILVQFLSWGKGVHLGLVVEGEDARLGLVLVVILPVTTHPLQCRGFELDMQETSATEVCESSFSFCKLVQVWLFLHPL